MHFLIMGIVLIMLSGCGVGGFEGPANTNGNATPDPLLKIADGEVSLGPVTGAQVSIYNLNSDGSKGQPLKTTVTYGFGQYTSSVAITGPSLYVATGGSYSDEATGQTMTIPTASPLRAAMDTVSSSMSIAITPLTELAVKQAGVLIATNIASANQLVSSLFKFDIVATQPLAPTLDPTANGFSQLNATQAQKDYALALAGISQMAVEYYSGSGGLIGVLGAMYYDISNNKALSSATALQFTTALSHFLASSNNQTGVSDINATNLVNAGGASLTLNLATTVPTTGQLPAGVSIYGASLLLTLPAGVSIRVSDFTSLPYTANSSVVYSSGVAPTGLDADGAYTPAAGGQPAILSLGVVGEGSTGWPLGQFLTVICDLPPGSSYTSKNFPVSQVSVYDGKGDVIPEVGVTVAVQ